MQRRFNYDNLVNLIPIAGQLKIYRDQKQEARDVDRRWFELIFPTEVPTSLIQSFIRSIGSNLRGGSKHGGVPSAVFETLGDQDGISHRIGVPRSEADYIINQLQHTFTGLDIVEIDKRDETGYQFGVNILMKNPREKLPIADYAALSHRILNTFTHAVQPSDSLVSQLVIAHSPDQKQPTSDGSKPSSPSLFKSLIGVKQPIDRDQLASERNKQIEQNYIVIGRVAARGRTIERAQELVKNVTHALGAEKGSSYLYPAFITPQQISHEIKIGYTPIAFPAQLDVAELSAVISWPPPSADTYVPGLRRGYTRHMLAVPAVENDGLVIGRSTLLSLNRRIAVSFKKAVTHFYIGGATETGKTTVIVNLLRQMFDNGSGVIFIQRRGDLYERALNEIPPDRVKDLVRIDLTDVDNFAGFNILRNDKPEIVAGQFASLLDDLYPDNKSLYTTQLVLHGIPVIASQPRGTVWDLLTFVKPVDPAEKAWAHQLADDIEDPYYQDFWKKHLKDLEARPDKVAAKVDPLRNRILELMASEAVRNLLNQEESSFDPVDILANNKILAINLAGAPEQAASLIGSMIVTAIGGAAMTMKPEKPNFLVMDEAHQFMHLSESIEVLLGEARKYNLGLMFATQYIERLKPKVQDALMANARNKIILASSVKSAGLHVSDFAHPTVKSDSFINLKFGEALVRLNTDEGTSPPMTVKMFPPPGEPGALFDRSYNQGRQVAAYAARKFGRTKEQIQHDDSTRRIARVSTPTQATRKVIGRSAYDTASGE